MTSHETPQELFAELRSLMHDIHSDEAWIHALCRALKLGAHLDAARYKAEWLPYMTSFVSQWPQPLLKVNADQLVQWLELVPTSRFELYMRGNETEWKRPLRRQFAGKISSLHASNLSLDLDHLEYMLSKALRIDGKLDLSKNDFGDAGVKALAASRRLKHVRELDLSENDLGVKSARALASAPYLGQLQSLALRQNPRFGERAIEVFVEANQMNGLRSLDLSYNVMTMASMTRLANSPMAHQLEELRLVYCDYDGRADLSVCVQEDSRLDNLTLLDVRDNMISPEQMRALVSSEKMKSLQALYSSHTWFDEETYSCLAHRSSLSRLQHLSLEGMYGEAIDLYPILHATSLPRMESLSLETNALDMSVIERVFDEEITLTLKRLFMGRNSLGSEGVTSLTSLSCLHHLEELDLTSTSIRTQGLVALARRPHMKALRRLDLSENDLDDDALVTFIEAGGLMHLTHLNLTRNALTTRGIEALANSPTSAHLESLALEYNQLENDALDVLLDSPHLRRLHTLDLRHNHIDDLGAHTLANSPHTGRFRTLRLASNYIRDQGYAALLDSPHMVAPLDMYGTLHHQFYDIQNLHE